MAISLLQIYCTCIGLLEISLDNEISEDALELEQSKCNNHVFLKPYKFPELESQIESLKVIEEQELLVPSFHESYTTKDELFTQPFGKEYYIRGYPRLDRPPE